MLIDLEQIQIDGGNTILRERTAVICRRTRGPTLRDCSLTATVFALVISASGELGADEILRTRISLICRHLYPGKDILEMIHKRASVLLENCADGVGQRTVLNTVGQQSTSCTKVLSTDFWGRSR